jgi:hypothetical protein
VGPTATLTPDILARFGPLLRFFQSASCRLFSRCAAPVGIFQRDLTVLCRGCTESLPILRILERLNDGGVKCADMKSLIGLVRREMKKQTALQLVGNGGALDQCFEDASLLEGQPFTSPLLLRCTDTTASAKERLAAGQDLADPCPRPSEAELDILVSLVNGSMSRLSKVLAFFLLEESPPRNAFASVEQLIEAIELLLAGHELGDIGHAPPPPAQQQLAPAGAGELDDSSCLRSCSGVQGDLDEGSDETCSLRTRTRTYTGTVEPSEVTPSQRQQRQQQPQVSPSPPC